MKFGLQIRECKMNCEFGVIGKAIADSLNRNRDIYFLKTLKKNITNLVDEKQEAIKVYSTDYRYLKINKEIIFCCFYDEFKEEGNPEVEIESFKTADFLPILFEFLEVLINENLELVRKLDSIYADLDLFVESKSEIIRSFSKRMDSAKIILNIGRENVDINYILKIYKLEFKDHEICLTKNRQYQGQVPRIFEFNNKGAKELVLYLKKDSEYWYKEKMKMYFDEEQKLVIVPDEDDKKTDTSIRQ